MLKFLQITFIAAGVLLCGVSPAPDNKAFAVTENVKLTYYPIYAYSWHLGRSVSISGDLAIVGAPHTYVYNTFFWGGSVFIFKRNSSSNWTWVDILLAPSTDLDHNELFGSSVSISGNQVIVGAPGTAASAYGYGFKKNGAAYVFERNPSGNWILLDKLTASDGEINDKFGWSVSISGNRAIIGAPGNDDEGESSGSAYIFERNSTGNWQEVSKLTALDAAPLDQFGSSVSMSGDTVIIGARYNDEEGDASGAAYIFELKENSWTQRVKLAAFDDSSHVGENFGSSVSISGNQVIVGAPNDLNVESGDGSAYAFERDASGTWKKVEKLTAPDPSEHDYFGFGVSISGNRAIIGAPEWNLSYPSYGSAYIFERDSTGNWQEVYTLKASDGDFNDAFGWSVSISGDRAIVGAPWDDDQGNASGSAYIFEFDAMNFCNRAITSFAGVIEGTLFSDAIEGTPGSDLIFGYSGNDVINGMEENDCLIGGRGNDVISGDYGNDVIEGGEGNDSIRGGFGDDQIFGDEGQDSLRGDHGTDVIKGGDGDDTISGGRGLDEIDGGSGSDKCARGVDVVDVITNCEGIYISP